MNPYKVFLASPNDLVRERKIIRDVISEINNTTANPLDIHVYVLGWEDIGPTFKRPQEEINKEVEESDLFLGLLWKRWGTKPGKGKYSSGFEEEYEVAKGKFKKTGKIDICIYFKEIKSAISDKENAQTSKVIKFKERAIRLNEFYFHEFSKEEELISKIRKFITEKIIAAHKLTNAISIVGAASVEGINRINENQIKPKSKLRELSDPALPELKTTFKKLIKQLGKKGDLDSVEQLDRIRVHLFSSAMLYPYTKEFLGVQEINLAYRLREKIKLLKSEKFLVIRSMIVDAWGIKPGWYWWEKKEFKNIEKWIGVSFSDKETDENFRLGCLKILKKIWSKKTEKLLLSQLTDENEKVFDGILEVLSEKGTEFSTDELRKYLNGNDENKNLRIWNTIFGILKRQNPERAARFLTETNQNFATAEDLKVLFKKINLPNLKLLKSHQDKIVKVYVYLELEERDLVTEIEENELQNSHIPELNRIGFRILIKNKKNINYQQLFGIKMEESKSLLGITPILITERGFKEDVIYEAFLTLPKDVLEEFITWSSIYAPIAYEAYGNKFYSEVKEQLHEDLANKFERIRTFSVSKIFGVDIKTVNENIKNDYFKKTFGGDYEEIDKFIRNEFVYAALSVVLKNGESEDIIYSRMYIKEDPYRLKKIIFKNIYKFGDQNDFDYLLKTVRDKSSSDGKMSIEKMLMVGKDYKETIKKLLSSTESEIIKGTLLCLIENKKFLKEINLAEYLYNPSDQIRLLALAHFVKENKNSKLKKMLKSYFVAETYYFDVVYYLDSLLYGPEAIQKESLIELGRHLA